MLELFLLFLLIIAFGLVVFGIFNLRSVVKDFCDYNNEEQERQAEAVAEADAVDKEKPWPVKLVQHQDGIQLSATNLNALEIQWGKTVIGFYDGWKIYDFVTCNGEKFTYENIVVKKNGRYVLPSEDFYLILAPGLAYRHVGPGEA